jgi:hypothetical protein
MASVGDGGYRSLFTRLPSHRSAREFGAGFAGASADGSHVLFAANDALLEGGLPLAQALNAELQSGVEREAKEDEETATLETEGHISGEEANAMRTLATERFPHVLYDSTSSGLSVVNVLPDGELAEQAEYGSRIEFDPSVIGNHNGSGSALADVVSADGSRVFWSTTEPVDVKRGYAELHQVIRRPKVLYVRENDTQPQSPVSEGVCTVAADACTIELDASTFAGSVKEKEEKGGGGQFWAASADGSKVFFTDENKLTSNSTAAPEKPDLYEYTLNSEAGKPGTLTDLTAGTMHGEPADVAGVLGASEDGSYVYFAAAAALEGSGARPQECLPYESQESGGDKTKCNVYVAHVGEAPKLATVVPVTDGEGDSGESESPTQLESQHQNQIGDWVPNIGYRSAHVTPDGRHLVFESVEDLTGQNSGGGRDEIYMYDVGEGLTCVSCNPDGSPSIRGAGLPESSNDTYALRDLSADGDQIFFDSAEALVPQDQNGLTDVYEWERDGSGSCERTGGCLYVLSGGTSSEFSLFLDASETGEDVFFASRADLVPTDKGEVFEAYDARVGATTPPAEPECTGTGCQGIPAASPIFATPSSVTFNGIGNFPPPPPPTVVKPKVKTVKCGKGKKLTHGMCVKQKRKKTRAKKSSRATNDRRAR